METRFLDTNTKKIIVCLNRTMQYGNFEGRKAELWKEACLNRTMQYGNCSIPYKDNYAFYV